MPAKLVEDGPAYLALAPTFKKPRKRDSLDTGRAIRVGAAKLAKPSLALQLFGFGWLSGFAAGAGLLAIFLHR